MVSKFEIPVGRESKNMALDEDQAETGQCFFSDFIFLASDFFKCWQ